MKIILAGIIGRYPWGGVTWCSLMYLLGLRALGHDVYYLEDTGECNYDPEANAIATDPAYALRYIDATLRPFELGDRWCYIDYTGRHHGMSATRWREVCQSAELFIVLSGGCWNWRDEYLAISRKVFVDSDPAFTQLALAAAREQYDEDEGKRWYVDCFAEYDHRFTFGVNVGTSHSDLPDGGFAWQHTWQPVCTDLWCPAGALPPRSCYTTVMTWQIESFDDIGGNKDQEFLNVLGLAGKLCERGGPVVELAISGPLSLLREHGWQCVDAYDISADLWRYHGYLTSSRGEFSVAKHTYVRTRSGWFSDRSECYLSAGRPVVVQDTGFSRVLPVGDGLLAWNTADEALAGLEDVERHYGRHAAMAREVAEEHFAAERVLRRLLEQAAAGPDVNLEDS